VLQNLGGGKWLKIIKQRLKSFSFFVFRNILLLNYDWRDKEKFNFDLNKCILFLIEKKKKIKLILARDQPAYG